MTPQTLLNQTQQVKLEDRHAALAIEVAGLGLWEFDRSADAVTISPVLAELLGRPVLAERAFPAAVLTDLTHKDDRSRVSEALERAERHGDGEFHIEHRITHGSGEERWLWIRATIVERSASGKAQKLVGVVQDCTDRKQVELALETEKSRYELAISGSLMAIWQWEDRTRLTSWSRRACEILGMDADALSGDSSVLVDRIHPDDQDRVQTAFMDHINTNAPFDVEMRMRHAAGHYLIVRTRGQAQRGPAGRIVRVAGSLVDMTAERHAQAEAEQAGKCAELALQAAKLGTWVYDHADDNVVMDRVMANLLDQPELAGQPVSRKAMFEFTVAEDRDAVRAQVKNLSEGVVDTIRSEHRIQGVKGRPFWILAHVGVAQRGLDGKPTKLVGIVQDLAEQKATESALWQSKERAEAASAAKSNFLATMSHEIRTPLNGMLGVAQLLGLSELDDRQRRYVATLEASGRVLTGVIEDILDISRIEAGKLRVVPEPVDTKAWLDEVLSPFHTAATQKGLSLTWSIEPEARHTRRFDPQRMAQVLGNLVSNAVKFTDKGSIIVMAGAPRPGQLRILVSDSGPGIAPDKQTAIFERFTQVDMSPDREHGGSGLGLAIAQELAKLAGGEVGVLSKPGEGATFWFEIPAPRTDTGSPTAIAESAEPGLEELRALIVEDNAINRETLVEMLNQYGVILTAVESGDAALDCLSTTEFDVVLLDLHMPGKGGYQVLRQIRLGGAGRTDIPVYLVTADATQSARDWANTLGADGFFSKPLDLAALIGTLSDLVRTKGAD